MNEEMDLNPQVPKTPDYSQIFALRQIDKLGICPSSGEGGGDNSGPGVGLVAGHANVISDPPLHLAALWPGRLAHLEDPRTGLEGALLGNR